MFELTFSPYSTQSVSYRMSVFMVTNSVVAFCLLEASECSATEAGADSSAA